MVLPLPVLQSIANSYTLITHRSIWLVQLDVLFMMRDNTFFVYAWRFLYIGRDFFSVFFSPLNFSFLDFSLSGSALHKNSGKAASPA